MFDSEDEDEFELQPKKRPAAAKSHKTGKTT